MREGIDFSDARPGGAAICEAGKTFVVRYLSNLSKGLTRAEIADYRSHNLDIAVVVEGGAQGALRGYDAGKADAAFAAAKLEALGLGCIPVYFAVDFDATAAQMPTVASYLQGAAAILGTARVGVYGSYAVLCYMQSHRVAGWYWQTYAWSGGRLAPFANLYQYSNGHELNGGAVDYTRAITPNFGQDESANMPLTESDLKAVANYLLNYPAYDGGHSISQVLKDIDGVVMRPVLRDGVYVSQIQDDANTGTIVREIEAKIDALAKAVPGTPDSSATAADLKTALSTLTFTAKAGA